MRAKFDIYNCRIIIIIVVVVVVVVVVLDSNRPSYVVLKLCENYILKESNGNLHTAKQK